MFHDITTTLPPHNHYTNNACPFNPYITVPFLAPTPAPATAVVVLMALIAVVEQGGAGM